MSLEAGLTLFAVVVALFLGVRSIRETRNIQRREFRHRLLTEITEWAIKVVSWRSDNREVITEMAGIEEGKVRSSLRLFHANIAEVQSFFTAITGLNTYIYKTSLKFQQGLPEDIQKLINDLKIFTDFQEVWRDKLFKDLLSGKADIRIEKDDLDKVDGLAKQATDSAGVVLEKIAVIKAKEIG